MALSGLPDYVLEVSRGLEASLTSLSPVRSRVDQRVRTSVPAVR